MKKIIIDTDLACDCDDAAAIAIANIFYKEKKIDLIAIVQCLKTLSCVNFLKEINGYFKNDITVGISDSCAFDSDNYTYLFIDKIKFDNRNKPVEKTSYEVLLDCLTNNSDITLIVIGQLNNLAQLYKRQNEFYKGKRIKDLIEKNIKEIVVMAGDFDSKNCCNNTDKEAEFNIKMDIPSAQYFFDNCKLPVYVLDFNEGLKVNTGAVLQNNCNNPVALSYKYGCDGGNRPSWDPLTVLYAITNDERFFSVTNAGNVKILDNGISIFEEGQGTHHLIKVKNDKECEKYIDSILQSV